MITADILLFVRVAETLSFKEAAKQLGISPSQASKRIASLELELRTRLIYRSPRSISLTSAGETLVHHYKRIYDLVEEARQAVGNLNQHPSGRLRFSVPTCLGASLLPSLYDEFMRRYPQVVLDAHTSESYVDIVAGGFDVVIRVAQRLTDSSLTARRLASTPLVLVAAPGYLKRHGTPIHPADLAGHSCLGLRSARQNSAVWHFAGPKGRFAVPLALSTTSDSNLALVLAACAQLGVLYVPKAVVANELRQDRLVTLLEDYCKGIDWGVFAVHSGRTPSTAATAFIEFVREFLPALEYIDRWRSTAPRAASAIGADVPAA